MRQVWLQDLHDVHHGGYRGTVLNVNLRSGRRQGLLRNVGVGNILRVLRQLRPPSHSNCSGTLIKRILNIHVNQGCHFKHSSVRSLVLLARAKWISFQNLRKQCFGTRYTSKNYGLVMSGQAAAAPITAIVTQLLHPVLGWKGMFQIIAG